MMLPKKLRDLKTMEKVSNPRKYVMVKVVFLPRFLPSLQGILRDITWQNVRYFKLTAIFKISQTTQLRR